MSGYLVIVAAKAIAESGDVEEDDLEMTTAKVQEVKGLLASVLV